MIFLSELNEMDRNGLTDFVNPYLIHPEIGLVVPKSGTVFSVDREQLLTEYGTAAYVGQRLGEYDPTVDYDYSPLDEVGDFEFVVKLSDHTKFIDLLFDLSYGFGNGDDEAGMFFWDEVETFIDDVDVGKVKPFCPDLVSVYHELVESLKEEDEEEDSD